MYIILFDNKLRESLYPFTQTRAVADLRYGIFTAKERWELISGLPVYINTNNYLTDLYEKPVPNQLQKTMFYLLMKR